MEYDYYLEQKYLHEGRVEARILTAAQAQAMGYQDDYRGSRAGYKLYVDGFNTMEAVHNYLSDLVNCTLVEQEKIADESKRIEAIVDFVTFEDETSLIWPWAIPAEELLQNQETLLKIASAIQLDETGRCDTDELYDAIDQIVGINPVLR